MNSFQPLRTRRVPFSPTHTPTSSFLRPSRPLAAISTTTSVSTSPVIQAQQETAASTAYPGHSFENIPLFPAEKKNQTGLPDSLKTGIEHLSGISMNDVNVHYNSSRPAAVQALAYTRGTTIHVGPGQERYLPHEAWHVVQQKQGRVKQTTQTMGVAINDDAELEHEASLMGEKATRITSHISPLQRIQERPHRAIGVIQCGKMTTKAIKKSENSKYKDTTKYDGQIYAIFQNKSSTADDATDPVTYVGQTIQKDVGDRFIQHTREDSDRPWYIGPPYNADYSSEDDAHWPYYPRELFKIKQQTLLEISASEEYYYEEYGGLTGKLYNKIQPLKKSTFLKYKDELGVYKGKGFPPGWAPKQ